MFDMRACIASISQSEMSLNVFDEIVIPASPRVVFDNSESQTIAFAYRFALDCRLSYIESLLQIHAINDIDSGGIRYESLQMRIGERVTGAVCQQSHFV